MRSHTQVLVWYDGGCPLCTREIALMQWLDRTDAINFIDLTDGQSTCPIDAESMLARFHAEEDGTLLSGAAAFAAMWRAIPLLRPLGLLARNATLLAALEWIYLHFLRVRPRLIAWMRA